MPHVTIPARSGYRTVKNNEGPYSGTRLLTPTTSYTKTSVNWTSIASTMNTISPPPQFKRLSGPKRVLGVAVGIAGGLGANLLLGYSVMSFYTRNTKFIPYDVSHKDLQSATHKSHNPGNNPPACIDHAIKQIPYAKLPEKYRIAAKDDTFQVDKAQLATDFCRGIWGGVGYRVQRKYLERKYRALPGREDHLWTVKDLEKSDYPVGTIITDHFEVLEHTPEKVRFAFKHN